MQLALVYITIFTYLKQLRAGETPSPSTGMLPYHEFGREKIFSAFSRLSEAIKDCKGMEIHLTNDITYSPGAYAWLKCASGVQCADELKELAGIEGTPGMFYGATNDSKSIIIITHNTNTCLQPNAQSFLLIINVVIAVVIKVV